MCSREDLEYLHQGVSLGVRVHIMCVSAQAVVSRKSFPGIVSKDMKVYLSVKRLIHI